MVSDCGLGLPWVYGRHLNVNQTKAAQFENEMTGEEATTKGGGAGGGWSVTASGFALGCGDHLKPNKPKRAATEGRRCGRLMVSDCGLGLPWVYGRHLNVNQTKAGCNVRATRPTALHH